MTDQYPTSILTSPDGEPVALHDFGGDGVPLLLGHGNGMNAGMWAAAAPHLRHHYHCYGIDLRGHGACRPVDPEYSVERVRFGEDILTCVDEVGGPVYYAGHSLGAASVVVAALARPDAFRALWLFEPVLVPEGLFEDGARPPSFLVESARRRRMEFDSVEDAFNRFVAKPPFNACDPIAVRAYAEIGTYPIEGGVRLSCHGENEARVFGSGQPLDFSRLAALTMPAVVAAGGETGDAHAIPARVAPLVAEALGNARFEVHPTLTHFGPMEDPKAIAESIVNHFEGTSPAHS